MFFQHVHFETLHPFAFELTDLAVVVEFIWVVGIFIMVVDISEFFIVVIDNGFHFFSG